MLEHRGQREKVFHGKTVEKIGFELNIRGDKEPTAAVLPYGAQPEKHGNGNVAG